MATGTKNKTNRSAMSPRLLALHGETNDPEPYPVTDDIIVQPLTRTRMHDLHAAELAKYFAQNLLARRAAAAVTAEPTAPVPAPDLPADHDEAQLAAWVAATTAHQELTAAYEAAMTEWKNAFNLDGIQAQIDEAEAAYDRAFFGDAYDAVIEFFEDKPALWDKFIVDIRDEFLPRTPESGVCPTCGRTTDADLAGKAPESST